MKNAIKFGFGITIGGILAELTLCAVNDLLKEIRKKIDKKSCEEPTQKINTPPGFVEWLKSTNPERYEEFKEHGLI